MSANIAVVQGLFLRLTRLKSFCFKNIYAKHGGDFSFDRENGDLVVTFDTKGFCTHILPEKDLPHLKRDVGIIRDLLEENGFEAEIENDGVGKKPVLTFWAKDDGNFIADLQQVYINAVSDALYDGFKSGLERSFSKLYADQVVPNYSADPDEVAPKVFGQLQDRIAQAVVDHGLEFRSRADNKPPLQFLEPDEDVASLEESEYDHSPDVF